MYPLINEWSPKKTTRQSVMQSTNWTTAKMMMWTVSLIAMNEPPVSEGRRYNHWPACAAFSANDFPLSYLQTRRNVWRQCHVVTGQCATREHIKLTSKSSRAMQAKTLSEEEPNKQDTGGDTIHVNTHVLATGTPRQANKRLMPYREVHKTKKNKMQNASCKLQQSLDTR